MDLQRRGILATIALTLLVAGDARSVQKRSFYSPGERLNLFPKFNANFVTAKIYSLSD